jgi:hypothetical protein|tara:strand:+ start:85 stop:255 length:171 start_codon:yes stop_codon:yes gene_type:complete
MKISKSNLIILGTAVISLVFSEYFYFTGDVEQAMFVGQWVPSILCAGVYFNILKNK